MASHSQNRVAMHSALVLDDVHVGSFRELQAWYASSQSHFAETPHASSVANVLHWTWHSPRQVSHPFVPAHTVAFDPIPAHRSRRATAFSLVWIPTRATAAAGSTATG
jgi:hypothetical protein